MECAVRATTLPTTAIATVSTPADVGAWDRKADSQMRMTDRKTKAKTGLAFVVSHVRNSTKDGKPEGGEGGTTLLRYPVYFNGIRVKLSAFCRGFVHLTNTVIGTLILLVAGCPSLSLRLISIMRFLGIITRNGWISFFGTQISKARFGVCAASPRRGIPLG
jgi:hypothetical protein